MSMIQTAENPWFILIVISILIIATVSFLNILVKKLYYAVCILLIFLTFWYPSRSLFHLTDFNSLATSSQNQFFISGLSGDEIIRNRVLEALFRRIMRAYNDKKCFRVIIVIPLLPGFQVKVLPKIHQIRMYYSHVSFVLTS